MLPLWYHNVGGASGFDATDVGWTIQIQPYIKSSQVLQCPSETTGPKTDPYVDGYQDYAFNRNLSLPNGGTTRGPVILSAVQNPTLTIMNGDRDAANAAASFIDNDAAAPLANMTEGDADRHLDGANYGFCDGHVKWYKGSSATRSPVIYSRNTPFATSGNNPTMHVTDGIPNITL